MEALILVGIPTVFLSRPIMKGLYCGPFDKVQTLAQIHPELNNSYFKEMPYEGPKDLTSRLVRENGYKGLFRGQGFYIGTGMISAIPRIAILVSMLKMTGTDSSSG